MNIDDIKKIELEITSDCNAACPGCARTLNLGKFEVTGFSITDLKRMFPTTRHIMSKQFKFCGVLGDPVVNPDFIDMVEYIVENNGYVDISTNGAYNTSDWWTRLGKLSSENNNVFVSFAIDGHKETNHIYRVNTKWSVLERNLEAYSKAGGQGKWIYIVFDHNEYELETARAHSKKLGFDFATRTGMRNSYHDWVAKIKKKDEQKKIVTEEKVITTSGKKEHSKVEKVKELDVFIEKAQSGHVTKEEEQSVLRTIKCKLIHQGEIYISSKQTMWPCCFLFDSTVWNRDNIKQKLSDYGNGWNSLKDKSVDDILTHPWFDAILEESWNSNHEKHLPRCVKTCGHMQAYHNEIKWEKENVV